MMVSQIVSQRSSSPSVVGPSAVSSAAKQNPTAGATKPKRLDQVRHALRARLDSRRMEDVYVMWIKRFIFFHSVHHLAEMGESEVNQDKGICWIKK